MRPVRPWPVGSRCDTILGAAQAHWGMLGAGSLHVIQEKV